MDFTGLVIRKTFAPGSKSEHAAVFLSTEEGDYKLERAQGNPFRDPEIGALVGKRVIASGRLLEGHTLRADSVRELD